jgi:hypothetical protein
LPVFHFFLVFFIFILLLAVVIVGRCAHAGRKCKLIDGAEARGTHVTQSPEKLIVESGRGLSNMFPQSHRENVDGSLNYDDFLNKSHRCFFGERFSRKVHTPFTTSSEFRSRQHIKKAFLSSFVPLLTQNDTDFLRRVFTVLQSTSDS